MAILLIKRLYAIQAKDVRNPKEHKNCIIDSKDMAILVNGQILPVGGVALVKGLRTACIAGFFLDGSVASHLFRHKTTSVRQCLKKIAILICI